MSVVAKMDMPKNCEECRFCFICERMFTEGGSVDCFCCKLKDKCKNEPYKYEFTQKELKNRQDFCPLKSVDGLIDKIEKINSTDYGSISSYESHNAVRDVKRDIIQIIEEYCGMED